MGICCTGKERKKGRKEKKKRVQNKYGAGHSESAVVNTVH
jgi:hypothetical protein